MAGLILTPNGSHKIPTCEKCGNYMLPLELDHIEKDMWKCPYCMSKQKIALDNLEHKEKGGDW